MKKHVFLYIIFLVSSCRIFEDKDNIYKPLLNPQPQTCFGKNFRILPGELSIHFLSEIIDHGYILAGKNIIKLDSVGQQKIIKELNAKATAPSNTAAYWVITIDNKLIKLDSHFTEEFQVDLEYSNLDKLKIDLIGTKDGGLIIFSFQPYTTNGFVQKRNSKGLLEWHINAPYSYKNKTKLIASKNNSYFFLLHNHQTNYREVLTKIGEDGNVLEQFELPSAKGLLSDIIHTNDDGFVVVSQYEVYKLSANLEIMWTIKNCCWWSVITQTADGNYMVGGKYPGIILHQLSKHGEIIWSITIDNLVLPEIYSINNTQDGGYLINLTVVNQYNGNQTVRHVDRSPKTSYIIKIDKYGNYCQ
jgi:hypothetical protein